MRRFWISMGLTVLAGAAIAANDFGLSITFLVKKGFLDLQRAYGLLYSPIDAANPGVGGVTVTATTNPAALNMGSVSTPGYAFFRNLSTATNTINLQLGVTNGSGGYVPVMQLRTGEVAAVRLAVSAGTLFVFLPSTAGTNTAPLEYVIVDQ